VTPPTEHCRQRHGAAPRRPVLLLLAATSCWGGSSATLAHEHANLAAGAPIVAAGAGAWLCTVALLRGRRPLKALQARPSLYARLGALDAVNLALFVAALSVGPLPVVVALHLTSPVLLIAADVVRRRRRHSLLVGLELTLIVGAVALVAIAVPAGSTAGDVLAGSALALGSAVAVAVLTNQISSVAGDQDPDVAGGLQLSLVALLALPLVVAMPPDRGALARLLIVGMLLLGPGVSLFWRAMKRVSAPLAGVLGLNEAVVASLIGALVFDAEIGVATVAAAALILTAVVLELRDGRRMLPDRG
jgi:drug/metabolite transporter (DMT)-like permease